MTVIREFDYTKSYTLLVPESKNELDSLLKLSNEFQTAIKESQTTVEEMQKTVEKNLELIRQTRLKLSNR
jgi:N-acetylglucosamine-6-phosphate deacetylase